jgi:serine/threonine protein phosphatase PrpC
VLSDGMGGMVDGASCAALAIGSFCNFVIQGVETRHPRELLYDAALYANGRVSDTYNGSGGATLSAVLMVPGPENGYWVNIGDSRIYSYGEERIAQITKDDTLAGQLSRDSSGYQGRNELLQFVGIGEMAEPHIGTLENRDHASMYALSSDGVHFLPINVIQQILAHAAEPAIAARRLTDLAVWCGGYDNASLATVSTIRESWQGLPATPPGVVEIWDPFGDARFFGIQSAGNSYVRRTVEQQTPSQASGEAKAPQHLDEASQIGNPQSQIASSSYEKEISRSSKRRKTSKKKSAIHQEVPEKVFIPQLMINFRKKETK